MIKHIILLFNLLGLFLYQLLFQANVNVSQSVPSNADPGSSFVVQVTINKADVSGFAKFQEDLPSGFTAEAVDKQGATVLSSGNAIKFIWASLPSDPSFKISFKVTVDASVSGAQTLTGKFLYVVNNERQESDPTPASITIGGGAATVAATQPAVTQPTTNTSQPVANNTQPATTQPDNSQPAANTSQPVVNNTQPATTQPDNSQPAANTSQPVVNNTQPATTQPDNSQPAANTSQPVVNNTQPATTQPTATAGPTINITRSYSATTVAPAADVMVTVTIHKGNLTGFAKLEETIPAGLFVSEGDKQGASFTFVDNSAKFVWLNLPADSVIKVTYKISVGSTTTGVQSIPGEFSYLLDNNALKYEVAATSFNVQSASQPVVNNTQPATTQPDNSQPAANTSQPVVNNTQPATTQPDNSQPAANTSQPVVNNTQPATTQPDNSQPAANTSQPVVNNTQPATTQPDNSQPAANTIQPVVNNTQPATTQPDNSQSASTSNSITPNIPGASGAVKYRVQIMALHNPVKTSYLARQYSISENINQEMLEGYTKYTVGSFDEYKSVRDHREEIKSKGVQGPFVVAYNAGKRVTVQEALMITHQQWYK